VVPSSLGRYLGFGGALLRTARRACLHMAVGPVLGARRRCIRSTPAWKAFRGGRSCVFCDLHRRARAHNLLRVLLFGTVFDGTRCARGFCRTPYEAHVPQPKRICVRFSVDGYLPVLQCSARIGRLGPVARQDRGPSGLPLPRCGARAPARSLRRLLLVLRFLLVLVEPFVLANETRIQRRSPRDRSLPDGYCAGSVIAILSARQSRLPDAVLDTFCGLLRRHAVAILSRISQHEASVGSNADIYRRRRLSALHCRLWRACSLWTIRLQRHGDRRPYSGLAIDRV
jgi:hypothetical protein